MRKSYKINISEQQRLALIKVLNEARLDDAVDEITGGHPLQYWVEMLTDLPNIECKHPDVLHGFCI